MPHPRPHQHRSTPCGPALHSHFHPDLSASYLLSVHKWPSKVGLLLPVVLEPAPVFLHLWTTLEAEASWVHLQGGDLWWEDAQDPAEGATAGWHWPWAPLSALAECASADFLLPSLLTVTLLKSHPQLSAYLPTYHPSCGAGATVMGTLRLCLFFFAQTPTWLGEIVPRHRARNSPHGPVRPPSSTPCGGLNEGHPMWPMS